LTKVRSYCQDGSGFLTCDRKSCAVVQQLIFNAIFTQTRLAFWWRW